MYKRIKLPSSVEHPSVQAFCLNSGHLLLVLVWVVVVVVVVYNPYAYLKAGPASCPSSLQLHVPGELLLAADNDDGAACQASLRPQHPTTIPLVTSYLPLCQLCTVALHTRSTHVIHTYMILEQPINTSRGSKKRNKEGLLSSPCRENGC